jgi:hypothetical protein
MTTVADEADAKPARPRQRRGRRWLFVLAILLVPLFIAYGFVCKYLERRLEHAVAQRLDAELRIDGLLYFPPYGVRLRSAHLVRKNNVILNLGRVNLKLAQSPFGGGPIVIENFDVTNPVIRIIRTREGLQGGPGFVKEEVKQEPVPQKKVSDLLRLRKFKITDGQVIYDDDTSPYARDVTWRDIDVEINTAQNGPALYTYELTFGNAPLVRASARGSFDVDSLVLALDPLHVNVHIDPKQTESPLPGALQKLLADHAVAGNLSIEGKGLVPFKELGKSTYDGAIELAGGTVRLPKWDTHFDEASIKLRLAASPSNTPATGPTSRPTNAPALNVAIDSIRVGSGGATLAVTGGTLGIDPAAGTWTLRELAGNLAAAQGASAKAGAIRDAIERMKLAGTVDFTAAADGPLKPDGSRRLVESIRHEVLLYPRGVVVQPKDWPEPLREVGGGAVRITGGEAVVEELSALYGQDHWLLNAARVPLEGLKEHVQIRDVDGSIDFHAPSPEYPKALRATVRALAPTGEFAVTGELDVDPAAEPGKRAKYDLVVSSDTGQFALTPKRIPLTNIRGKALVRRDAIGTVDIRSFDADSLGGTVSAKATFITTKPRSYAGEASLRDVKLEQLAAFFAMPEEKKHRLVGRAFANVELSGETEKQTALDSLRGRARVEVFDGDFFEIPVLSSISKTVTGGRHEDLGTVEEAALLFTIQHRTIRLHEAALSAPLVGVQGGGEIGFDGKLDLNLVAAPLADWRDKLKQTNVPVVSDVTGEVAGAIQRLLNTATRGLLYEFKVVGDVKNPETKLIPAPVLNNARAAVFGAMLGKSKDKHLIDSLKHEDAEAKK